MTNEDRQASYLVDVVNWSESSGTLPVEGAGITEQSNLFSEARDIVLHEKNKIEHERQKEYENKSKANASKSAGKGRVGRG